MGTTGRWRCLDCGNDFNAREGGGFYFSLYRCVNCDRTKEVTTAKCENGEFIPIEHEDPGKCSRCGGELSDDIGPMCRKCKSRNVELIEITMFYD